MNPALGEAQEECNPHIGMPLEQYMKLNFDLVHKAAQRYVSLARSIGFDYEDLTQYASIGFIKAYRKYDPTKFKNVSKFSTYGMPMMWGEIQRALREHSPGLRFNRETKRFVRMMQMDDELIGVTDTKVIAQKLGIQRSRARDVLYCSEMSVPKHLDAEVANRDDSDPITLYDRIPRYADYTLPVVKEFLLALPERERLMVVMRMQDRVQHEIAEAIGVSQVQVSRIFKKIGIKFQQYVEGSKADARLA